MQPDSMLAFRTVPLLVLVCVRAIPGVVAHAPEPSAPNDILVETTDRVKGLHADLKASPTTDFATDRPCESLVDLLFGKNVGKRAEFVSMWICSEIIILGQKVSALGWASGAVCMFFLCVVYFTCFRTRGTTAMVSDQSSSSRNTTPNLCSRVVVPVFECCSSSPLVQSRMRLAATVSSSPTHVTCLPENKQGDPELNSASLSACSAASQTAPSVNSEHTGLGSLSVPPPPVVRVKSSAIHTHGTKGVIRLAWNYGPVSLELMPSRIRAGLPFLLLQRRDGVVSVLAPTPSARQWRGFLEKYISDEAARNQIDSSLKGRPLVRVLEANFEGSEHLHHQVRDWLSKVASHAQL